MAATDAEITQALKDTFKIPTLNGTNTYTLTFNYNDREYTFIFTMTHTKYNIRINNKCIKLTSKPDGELDSMISANSDEKKCFSPILKTNSRNKPEPRIKNIDVLQVLKSKLALCLPNKKRVRLYDAARSDYVELSKFSIMRGGDGVYEKYGYTSELMNIIKKNIRKMTFNELNDFTQKDIEKVYYEHLPGELLPHDGLITDILQKISFEVENETRISEEIFYSIVEDAGMDYDEVVTYFLDSESAEWKGWNKKLLFTDLKVEIPPAAPAAAAATTISMEQKIAGIQNAIEIAKKALNDKKLNSIIRERLEDSIRISTQRLKELEAQRGGKRSGEKRQRRQTKKNRRHK
jgi:hypothetical protein